MARCRIIRPEFFTHEALYDAEQASGYPLRVAYAGLWCVADREGRFEWRPRVLRLDIMPYDVLDFEDVLMALVAAGFVESYFVDGKRYGLIPAFIKYQKPHHREPPSRCPPPPSSEAPEKPGLDPGNVAAPSLPSLTDTVTSSSNRNTEAVAVTESDTEVVKAAGNLPRSPFSALRPNGGESPEEKRLRLKAGFAAQLRESAKAGNPGVQHPEIVA